MMSKTHYAVGMAASLAVVQPDTFSACLLAVAAGAVGGVLPDNDVLESTYRSGLSTGQLFAVGTVVLMAALDYFFQLGICQTIAENQVEALRGAVAFAALWCVGFFSDHRSFTHSILALLSYSTAVAWIHPPLAVGFAAAYLSHLALDILNRKKVRIFYPLKFGVCLKLCYANKTANKVFMYLGFALSGLLLLSSLLRSMG